MELANAGLNGFGGTLWFKNLRVFATSSWKAEFATGSFVTDLSWSADRDPSSLDKTSRNLELRVWGWQNGPPPTDNKMDPDATPACRCAPCAFSPRLRGTVPNPPRSSECWPLESWHPRELSNPIGSADSDRSGGPRGRESPPPRTPRSSANLTPGSSLQLSEKLPLAVPAEPEQLLVMPSAVEQLLEVSLELVRETVGVPVVAESFLRQLNLQLNLGPFVAGRSGLKSWDFATSFVDSAARGPFPPWLASLPGNFRGPLVQFLTGWSETWATSSTGWSPPRPRSSATSSSGLEAACWESLDDWQGDRELLSLEAGLAIVREIFSTVHSESCGPCGQSTPFDWTLTWFVTKLDLKKLFGGWEHNWITSNKYNSVGFSSRLILRSRRCRKNESFVVSKIPPSCLKALLLNKNGVLPGKTSMVNHKRRFEWGALCSGSCTWNSLCKVWLLPNLNFTWLGALRTFCCRLLGSFWKSCFQIFSPITHLLAPVSRIAWHCRSPVDAKWQTSGKGKAAS